MRRVWLSRATPFTLFAPPSGVWNLGSPDRTAVRDRWRPQLAAGSVDAMGTRCDVVESHRDEIRAAVVRHRGTSVALFGSVARGDDDESSDIDFLVDFEDGSSLFDLLHLTEELETLLGLPVDVVSSGGLKDRDDHIRSEALPL